MARTSNATRQRLVAGEAMILDARPHWQYFIFHAFVTVVYIVVVALVAHFTGGWFQTAWRWLASGGGLILVGWLLWHFLQWNFTHFQVTSRRVIWRTGVLSRHGVEIPLDRLNNVNFHQSITERIVGAGDLVIESAGKDGQSRFTDIRHPDHVQTIIHQAMESMRTESLPPPPAGTAATGTAPLAGGDPLADLERLADLFDRGMLSDAEFQRAKARLLDEI